MKKRIRGLLRRWYVSLLPAPDLRDENQFLRDKLGEAQAREADYYSAYVERAAELIEARQMAGTGPWLITAEGRREAQDTLFKINESVRLRETTPVGAIGAYGDIELALQNVEWRREINLSWLEFSRWGIQQIILISRLYMVKNPLILRCINVISTYVFGRGFEVTSTDNDANDVLREFYDRNKKVVGQDAMVKHQRSLCTDGQIFFALFSDTQDKGKVTIRTIDATEIQEVITNPDDTDEPWLYKRQWTSRAFDMQNGSVKTNTITAYYPALGYKPTDKPPSINGNEIHWDVPLIHHRGGISVAKWHFDVPRAYPALDWAKASKNFLENCATVKRALAQIAIHISTKGGQAALQGIKGQLQTSVGPTTPIWDSNPPAVAGAVMATGPGTTLEAFNTKGAGGDPEEVRRFLHMVAICFDIPETFLADASTGSLATAQSLDRPTELAMNEKQENWREFHVTVAQYVLSVSKLAPAGQLKEALEKRKVNFENIRILEAARRYVNGRSVYIESAEDSDTGKVGDTDIEVRCAFPPIREGDLPALVHAIVESMTLDNKGGQVIGIDEKTGVRLLLEQLGVENAEDVLEEMYPEGEYDPDRTKEPLPAPIPKAQPAPGGLPQGSGGAQPQLNGTA